MKKIKFYLGIGYANSNHEETFEYDDDYTDEEIDADFEDWKNNYIDTNWWIED